MNKLPPLMPPDQLIRYLLHRIDNTLMCERGAELGARVESVAQGERIFTYDGRRYRVAIQQMEDS